MKNNYLNISFLLIVFVYVTLTLLNINHPYFWDNIQQISKEAHWFYLLDMQTLTDPFQNSEIGYVGTGYHPPLIGVLTSMLWKLLGYNLWVSHFFVFVWFVFLVVNLFQVIRFVIPDKYVGWVAMLILFESTLLAQFSISSPDFILFSAFIIAVRGILDNKKWLIVLGIFFLCSINMRGVFAGILLYMANNYYSYLISGNRYSKEQLFGVIVPYLPTLLILGLYYIFYFIANGWFFTESSPYASHYSMPESVGRVIAHLAEFGLRSLENGRFVIWIIGLFVAYKLYKAKEKLSIEIAFFLVLFLLLTGLYFVFVFITQMPFSARYFMLQYFILTLVSSWGVLKHFKAHQIKYVFFAVLFFEVTGHLWIYPDKVAKGWDCTLAHYSYYELREECFDFIDREEFDYSDISAGFCLYGDRKYVELAHENKIIGTDPDRRYFIYSNISNLDDELAFDLQNTSHWKPIKSFEKGFVNIIIYEKR